MITKITDETTVKEGDFSGGFDRGFDINSICSIDELSDYIAEHTKPEPDYDEILNNPEKRKILIEALRRVIN